MANRGAQNYRSGTFFTNLLRSPFVIPSSLRFQGCPKASRLGRDPLAEIPRFRCGWYACDPAHIGDSREKQEARTPGGGSNSHRWESAGWVYPMRPGKPQFHRHFAQIRRNHRPGRRIGPDRCGSRPQFAPLPQEKWLTHEKSIRNTCGNPNNGKGPPEKVRPRR